MVFGELCGGIIKLFFFGLAKVLGVAFRNHLGIMQVLSVVDEVEKEGLCHTVNPDFIIAHIKLRESQGQVFDS